MAKPQLTLVENTGSWRGRVDGRVSSTTHEITRRQTAQSLTRVEQLDLFDGPVAPDLRVFVVCMDTVHGRTLQNAVLSCRPRSVIDLRYVARFDQYGSNRDSLFECFKAVGSYYAMDSMPWHDLSIQDFMIEGSVDVPRVHHELLERNEGAVMLFVPKPPHASMLTSYLNRMLSVKAKTSWRIELLA